jgi:hypothetical protein
MGRTIQETRLGYSISSRHELSHIRWFSAFLLGGLAVMLAGCGGGGSSTALPRAPNVTVLLQDAPADGVAAFSIGITTVSLNGADGQTLMLTSSAQTMEVRHVQLSPTVVFQGYVAQSRTYNSLKLSLSNPELTVRGADGKIVRINSKTTPFAQLASSKVTIPLAVTVNNLGHVGLMLDFDLEHSITNDGSGNYIIKPVIKASIVADSARPTKIGSALAIGSSAQPVKLRGALAVVTHIPSQVPMNAVGWGTSNQQFFEIQLHDTGESIPVVVDSSTVIDGAIGQLAELRMGQIIYLSADFQENGTFLANSIAARPRNSSQHYEGPVTGVYKDTSGNVSLDVVVQN